MSRRAGEVPGGPWVGDECGGRRIPARLASQSTGTLTPLAKAYLSQPLTGLTLADAAAIADAFDYGQLAQAAVDYYAGQRPGGAQ